MVKNPPANVGDSRDVGLLLGLGRSPGVANDTPLQNPCLENSMTREPWQAIVHGAAESNKVKYDNSALFWETQGLWETRDSILKVHTKFYIVWNPV